MSTQKLLESLTVKELARINRFALERGWMITSLEDRQEELEEAYQPKIVIPAEKMVPALFPHLDEETFEALRSYYAASEKHGLGYEPFTSQAEKNSRALLLFWISWEEKGGGLVNRYPIRKVEKKAPIRSRWFR
jgi:hypothetical protein